MSAATGVFAYTIIYICQIEIRMIGEGRKATKANKVAVFNTLH